MVEIIKKVFLTIGMGVVLTVCQSAEQNTTVPQLGNEWFKNGSEHLQKVITQLTALPLVGLK